MRLLVQTTLTCALAVLVLGGCSGSQVGGESRQIPWIAIEGPHAAVLTYADGGTTDLTVLATPITPTVRLARVASEAEAQASPELVVHDGRLGFGGDGALLFDVSVEFETTDGGFAERWDDLLVFQSAARGELDHDFSPEEMRGSCELPAASFVRVVLNLNAGSDRTYGSLDAVQAPPCGAEAEGSQAPCPPREYNTFATFEPTPKMDE